MVIFIDESGSFANPQGKPNVVSCIGALSVPETCIDELFAKFQLLKKSWNVEGEVKGSQLNEEMAEQLVKMCLKFDITFKVVGTDLGLMEKDSVYLNKIGQAEKLRVSAGEVHPNMVEVWNALADRIADLPDQLYAQSYFMTLLLDKVFRETILYYCQREAHCLGSFVWIIDAKDKNKTEYEKLWTSVCMPFLQTLSVEEPLLQLREGDYSAFARYQKEKDRPPEHIAPYLKPEKIDKPFHYVDIKELLSALVFADSKKEIGLQLVDLLTTIVRRSLSLTLQMNGWKNIGKLMLQVPKGENVVLLAAFGNGSSKVTTPYGKIISHYNQTARSPFKR